MSTNHQTQAVLLLTAHLGGSANGNPKPLSPTEWGRFAQWLKDRDMAPEILLQQDPSTVLASLMDRSITIERIEYLLNRAGALGIAMERWERAGLWVLIRSDPDYPTRLKRWLKMDSPPVFFGCGYRTLLNRGGIAVIGSREASKEDLAFTGRLGAQAALEGLSVVSGGARGVDEAAMLGALKLNGRVVGVLSDSLLRAATSAKYREGLMNGNLALVSPFNPEAGFDVGNAMARNRYIYCLSDAAVVIAAGAGKGGTWNGATENLKNGWVPLWVKRSQDSNSGNSALVNRGARWLPENESHLSVLFDSGDAWRTAAQGELLGEGISEATTSEATAQTPVASGNSLLESKAEYGTTTDDSLVPHIPLDLDFYTLFLARLEQLTTKAPATHAQLLEALKVNKSQLNTWLDRAMAEGSVRKLSKPVRYTRTFPAKQPSLFDTSGR